MEIEITHPIYHDDGDPMPIVVSEDFDGAWVAVFEGQVLVEDGSLDMLLSRLVRCLVYQAVSSGDDVLSALQDAAKGGTAAGGSDE